MHLLSLCNNDSSAFQMLIRALSVFAFGEHLVSGHLTQRAQHAVAAAASERSLSAGE